MTRRGIALNGVIAGLAFLVLVQAFELVAAVRVGWGPKAGVAVLVGAVAAILSLALARGLAGNGSA